MSLRVIKHSLQSRRFRQEVSHQPNGVTKIRCCVLPVPLEHPPIPDGRSPMGDHDERDGVPLFGRHVVSVAVFFQKDPCNVQTDLARRTRLATEHEDRACDIFDCYAATHRVEVEDTADLVANEHHVAAMPVAVYPPTRKRIYPLGGPLTAALRPPVAQEREVLVYAATGEH